MRCKDEKFPRWRKSSEFIKKQNHAEKSLIIVEMLKTNQFKNCLDKQIKVQIENV